MVYKSSLKSGKAYFISFAWANPMVGVTFIASQIDWTQPGSQELKHLIDNYQGTAKSMFTDYKEGEYVYTAFQKAIGDKSGDVYYDGLIINPK